MFKSKNSPKNLQKQTEGNEVVFDTRIVPRAEITIEIIKIHKDDYGLDSKFVTVYDTSVKNAIGTVNGETARFVSQDAIDYKIGDKGIFLIDTDRGLWLHGFMSFYPIEDSKSTIQSEFDKKYGKDPLELQIVKDIAKLKDKETRKRSIIYLFIMKKSCNIIVWYS